LHLPAVDDDARLLTIVRAHLGEDAANAEELVAAFLGRASTGELATDQLLNAVYLAGHSASDRAPSRERLAELVFQHLNVTVPTTP
jgi:hypothetical protein